MSVTLHHKTTDRTRFEEYTYMADVKQMKILFGVSHSSTPRCWSIALLPDGGDKTMHYPVQ